MAAGLPDRVDCARLAAEGAVLERDYELGELPRLQDLLADTLGRAHAVFAFVRMSSDRPGARVTVEAAPHLVCQRCLQATKVAVSSSSEIEFAGSEDADPEDPAHEIYVMQGGLVSLAELAEEELLLALPTVATCASAQSCGRAPEVDSDRSRPFAALQDLLKKP
jgi:uncharacterized metal-binding protein YceD (DUF177 family)